MPETIDKETLRELIESDRTEAISVLTSHPACANRLHPNRRTWEYCWRLANNIAPEQLKERKEQQEAEQQARQDPAIQKRIDEIEHNPVWKNRLAVGHKALHREWLGLHQKLHQ